MSAEAMGSGYVPEWTFGDRLRKARESVDLDQTAFGRDLGVSRQTISNAERGENSPRRSLVMAWAMRTRVSLQWLETGEAPSPGGDGAPQKYTPRELPGMLGAYLFDPDEVERVKADRAARPLPRIGVQP